MESKRAAAEKAVEYIRNGMIIGLGTGSTAYWAIQKLGINIKDGLRVKAVATSIHTENLAKELKIPLISISEIEEIDITVDGADEVDDEWNLIKGGGGAHLREKIVASMSKELIIVVDESKKVNRLGKFPLPVEIVIFNYENTQKKLSTLGCVPQLRIRDNKPFLTDNGNYIVDCDFGSIGQPRELHTAINSIPGVVENGLFIKMATKVIIGYQDGSVKEQ
ncbi:ribose-5-phosphate isomerase RpiA [Paenibacillus spongiae]|uniref:Ribose-5-phosphate isomerase A n=1 Tax=Paenibacillus spongiae TaxID=2909671 RepID=A0ABY5SHD4_9BACL|nr:ribose-5-phosphate isomerase RpiA [Paenibacillus spongiae]UVI33411.1 ribose-5-phosphate isomerase RpiA [Paenibacillus spongiae]